MGYLKNREKPDNDTVTAIVTVTENGNGTEIENEYGNDSVCE